MSDYDDAVFDDDDTDATRDVVWSGQMPRDLLTAWWWLGGKIAEIPHAQRHKARIDFEDDQGFIRITLPKPERSAADLAAEAAERKMEAGREADRISTRAFAAAQTLLDNEAMAKGVLERLQRHFQKKKP